VIVVTAEELSAAIAANPLGALATDQSRFLIGFLAHDADRAPLELLAVRDWSPEALALGERVVYAWCPHGVTGSPLLGAVSKAVGDAITTRNWSTVLKLQTLMGLES